MRMTHVNLRKIAAIGLAVSVMTGCSSAGNNQVTDETAETTELYESKEKPVQTRSEKPSKLSEQDILALSKTQFKADFEALEKYDLEEAEQLAIILAARYVDMQQRIDLEALRNLSPQIKSGLENNEEETIRQFLTTDNYELYGVDSAVLEDDTLKFKAAYSFTVASPGNENNKTMLYTKFVYQWEDESWTLMATGEDARPDLKGKPNRTSVLWEIQDETKKVFGVEDMTELFQEFGSSYREEYEAQYSKSQSEE